MTNEEKIKEIAENQPFAFSNDNYRLMIEWGAEKMAEYKDSLLRERLDIEIEKANEYYDKKLSIHRIDNHIGAIVALSDILGIPFPYDRLHMGFATMD